MTLLHISIFFFLFQHIQAHTQYSTVSPQGVCPFDLIIHRMIYNNSNSLICTFIHVPKANTMCVDCILTYTVDCYLVIILPWNTSLFVSLCGEWMWFFNWQIQYDPTSYKYVWKSGSNTTMASKATFKALFILLAGLKVLKGSKSVSRNSKLSFTDGLSIC